MCLPLSAGVRINGIGITFPTIQDAVNASLNGDRLHVSTGLYAETVNITNKHITIAGGYLLDYVTRTNDPDTTELRGNGVRSTMRIVSNSVIVIETLAITGGDGFVLGGGIDVFQGCTLTTRFVTVRDNQAFGGGGINVRDYARLVMMTNTYVMYNNGGIGGGVLAMGTNALVILEGPYSEVSFNDGIVGGGVVMLYGTYLQRNGGYVYANLASVSGGGISLYDGAFGIIMGPWSYVGGPVFLMNIVTNGHGGGVYLDDSTLTVTGPDCFIGGNYTFQNGGGIYMTNSTLRILDGAQLGFPSAGNIAQDSGGGIYALHSSVYISNKVRITRCLAVTNGGGICTEFSSLHIYKTLLGNTNSSNALFADEGAGIYSLGCQVKSEYCDFINCTADAVSGALLYGGTGLFHHCRFANNTATNIGAAAFLFVPYTVMNHCVVTANHARSICGGLYAANCGPVIISNDSCIAWNSAEDIGAIYNVDTPVFLDHSTVHNNEALEQYGGIVHANNRLSCVDCLMYSNQANLSLSGAGIAGSLAAINAEVTLRARRRTSTLSHNSSAGGGGMYLQNANAVIDAFPPHRYLVSGNYSSGRGGAIYAEIASTATVSGNVTFDSNHADSGGGAVFVDDNSVLNLLPAFQRAPLLIQNTTDGIGGGIQLWSDSVLNGVNCEFRDNTATSAGGAIYSEGSRIALRSNYQAGQPSYLPHVKFSGNRAGTGASGGAIMLMWNSDAMIDSALFISNSAGQRSAALGSLYSTCRLVNVVAAYNHADKYDETFGSAADYLYEMLQCTVVYNGATGIWAASPGPILENSIVWGHSGGQVNSNVTASFCDIQGGFPGSFIITNDPLFLDPAVTDFQLQAGSPCINKGFTLVSVTNDCLGQPRPFGGGWDIGAYEFIPEPGACMIIFVVLTYCFHKKSFVSSS
jgi:predicted outer membrane repeat protein